MRRARGQQDESRETRGAELPTHAGHRSRRSVHSRRFFCPPHAAGRPKTGPRSVNRPRPAFGQWIAPTELAALIHVAAALQARLFQIGVQVRASTRESARSDPQRETAVTTPRLAAVAVKAASVPCAGQYSSSMTELEIAFNDDAAESLSIRSITNASLPGKSSGLTADQ